MSADRPSGVTFKALVSQRLGAAGLDLIIVLAVSWLARAAYWVVFENAQSNDVTHWLIVLEALDEGRNPYETGLLNWPPLWLVVLVALDAIADVAQLAFVSVLRVFLILVESFLVVALYRVLVTAGASRAAVRRALLAGIALNPVAILLVIQHGNSDVIVGLFVVLAVGSLVAYARSRVILYWLGGCLFLGLGVLAKTVPLMLAPILAPGMRVTRSLGRALGGVLFLGPVVLGMGVILVLAPAAVMEHVIQYRSQTGYFGISAILYASGHGNALSAFEWASLFAFVVSVVLLWRWLSREPPPGPDRLMLLAGLLLLSVLVLGPGYAPQYAYWFLPAFIGTYVLLDEVWRGLLRVGYIILCLDYTWEYGLLPQYGQFAYRFAPDSNLLAELTDLAGSEGAVMLVRLPLFAVSILVVVEGARRLARSPAGPGAPIPDRLETHWEDESQRRMLRRQPRG